jgi:uncharacterized protein YjiS (DUF1127 family)
MSCASANCTSAKYIQPSFPDRRRFWQVLLAGLARIAVSCERRHQRTHLLELNDHLLADIGLTRQQALDEAGKSSWFLGSTSVIRGEILPAGGFLLWDIRRAHHRSWQK